MKKILLVILVLPFISQAQKFEVSAQAGNLITYDGKNVYRGLSDQVTFSYHITKHIAASVFYERNSWFTKEQSFGISSEYTSGHFFTGLDLKVMDFNNAATARDGAQYKNSFGYGAHVGLKQNLSRHLSIIEQAGYCGTYLIGTLRDNRLFFPDYTTIVSSGSDFAMYNHVHSLLNYGYLRAGLSYRF